jgi:hypothetical protein
MPVAEGVPLAIQFDSLPYAGQAIHKYKLEFFTFAINKLTVLDKSNYYLFNML